MSAHTPGPWAVPLDAPGDITAGHSFVAAALHSGVVGETWLIQGPSVPIDQAGANARLIAAAPELLEALRNCAEIMARMYGRAEANAPALKLARAAIAKATEETA